MRPKKDIFDLFKDNQHKLNERPSQQAWDRLESRLDSHKERNRTSIYRILSMAAAIVVLVAFVSIISTLFNTDAQMAQDSMSDSVPVNQSILTTFKTEELKVLSVSNEGHRQIAAYQKKYNQHLSSPIMEGKSNKKLIARVNPQRRDNNLNSFIAKAKREKEQSLAATSLSSGTSTVSYQPSPALETSDNFEVYAEESLVMTAFDSEAPIEKPSLDIAASESKDIADEDEVLAQEEEEAKIVDARSKKKAKQ